MHLDDVSASDPWLGPWFRHPVRADLPTGHHLRLLRPADACLPGVPEAEELAAALGAAAARAAYAYGVFDDEERSVLGVVTLGPEPDRSCDVVVRWRVPAGASLGAALAAHLPGWVERAWPFATCRVEEEPSAQGEVDGRVDAQDPA